MFTSFCFNYFLCALPFQDLPTNYGTKVIIECGSQACHMVIYSNKTSSSVMIAGFASGAVSPTNIVYKILFLSYVNRKSLM